MLVQRLTNRLNTLSDSELAQLLEQVLKEEARFPAHLLKPQPLPQPAAATAPLGPTQEPTLPKPQLQLAPSAATEQQQSPQTYAQQQAAGQQEEQPRAPSVADHPSNNTSLENPSQGIWRVALLGRDAMLAVVLPSALIAGLSKVVGKQEEQQQQQGEAGQSVPAQAGPPQEASAPSPTVPAQQAQQQQEQQAQQPWSVLSWIFGPEEDKSPPAAPASSDSGLQASAAPAEQTSAASAELVVDGRGEQPYQQQPAGASTLAAPPPPPPLPPGAGQPQVLGSSAAAIPPGTILWQRKEPEAQAADSTGTATGHGPVLWRRAEPAEGAAAADRDVQPVSGSSQQAPAEEPGLAAGERGEAAAGSLPRDADLWRMPLEQLRAVPAPAETVTAGTAEPSIPSTVDGEVANGTPSISGTTAGGNTAAKGIVEQHMAASHVNGSEGSLEANGAAVSAGLGRRQASGAPDSALDNAEPAGWFGRLPRMGRRGTAGAAASALMDDE